MSWSATKFDGRSAEGEIVSLSIDEKSLVVASRRAFERVPIASVGVPESFAHAPRMLALPDGVTLEVVDPDRSLPNALAQAGVRTSWVVRMQKAWGAVLVALALAIGLGIWFYVEGLPVVARKLAQSMPVEFDRRIGENVLALLDERMLKPSQMPVERRAAIIKRFEEAARVAAPGTDVRVEFRSGTLNAFALPGGTLVMFDEMVTFAGSDDVVLAVLGHELGHVVHRHSMRQLFQVLGVGALVSVIWGDFSTAAANVPLLLGMMRYGRAFENEADDYALEFLRVNGMAPRPLYDFFVRIEGEKEAKRLPAFASSHPTTEERLARIKQAVDAHEKR
ncbi:MAG TPA: M48 family metallopeptidase [Casimicrobiaceae bacterium]|nr:M48 family metallopeptidase [Casimicrobiaceae bacterium]